MTGRGSNKGDETEDDKYARAKFVREVLGWVSPAELISTLGSNGEAADALSRRAQTWSLSSLDGCTRTGRYDGTQT